MGMLKATIKGISFRSALSVFQTSCIRRLGQAEMHPPVFSETEAVIEYLQSHGLKPVIIGSSAVVAHLGFSSEKAAEEFRPTSDLDIIVQGRIPEPPEGWRRDLDAPGLISWISPSGGTVDILQPGMPLPNGKAVPKAYATDQSTLPIADLPTLFKLKLSSFREKDISDLLQLARVTGVPKLTGLSKEQKENLEYLDLMLAQ